MCCGARRCRSFGQTSRRRRKGIGEETIRADEIVRVEEGGRKSPTVPRLIPPGALRSRNPIVTAAPRRGVVGGRLRAFLVLATPAPARTTGTR